MGGLLALLMLLVFGDVHRRNSEAILTLQEQEAIASGLAMGLSARPRSRAGCGAVGREEPVVRPVDPTAQRSVFRTTSRGSAAHEPGPREGQVALSVALDENRRAYFLLSLSRLRSDLRQNGSSWDVRMLLLPPLSQQFQTLNGRQVSSDLLLQGLRSPSHHIRIPKEIAAEPVWARDALAGLAGSRCGDMGIWAVAVVATARRALDREAQASWRSILAILCAAGLVLLLMMGPVCAAARATDRKRWKWKPRIASGKKSWNAPTELPPRGIGDGIAHEMSTPLGVIATRAEQLCKLCQQS